MPALAPPKGRQLRQVNLPEAPGHTILARLYGVTSYLEDKRLLKENACTGPSHPPQAGAAGEGCQHHPGLIQAPAHTVLSGVTPHLAPHHEMPALAPLNPNRQFQQLNAAHTICWMTAHPYGLTASNGPFFMVMQTVSGRGV